MKMYFKKQRKMDIPDETTGDIEAIAFVDPTEVPIDLVADKNYTCIHCQGTFTEEEMKGQTDRCPDCGEQDGIDAP